MRNTPFLKCGSYGYIGFLYVQRVQKGGRERERMIADKRFAVGFALQNQAFVPRFGGFFGAEVCFCGKLSFRDKPERALRRILHERFGFCGAQEPRKTPTETVGEMLESKRTKRQIVGESEGIGGKHRGADAGKTSGSYAAGDTADLGEGKVVLL